MAKTPMQQLKSYGDAQMDLLKEVESFLSYYSGNPSKVYFLEQALQRFKDVVQWHDNHDKEQQEG